MVMKKQNYSWLQAFTWAYIWAVLCWFIAYLLFGDRFGFLALVNSLAVYLFLPLPILIIVAGLIRKNSLWIGALSICLVFLWLWGGLFIPIQNSVSARNANKDYLSVMTYNLLGWQSYSENQIEIIRKQNADVVMLQELNFSTSRVVESELGKEYPYQILSPGNDVTGMGIISKFPIQSTDTTLQGEYWVGDPQIVIMEWYGKTVYIINIHMWPTNSIMPQEVRETSFRRELQAEAIGEFMDFIEGDDAVIVAGDTNTTSLSDAYKIIVNAGLLDSWKEAGFGFGHTFPGSNIPGSSRPVVFGIPSPQWMVRIDYIFHSNHWHVESAHIAPFDQVSDHRAVTAFLDWVE